MCFLILKIHTENLIKAVISLNSLVGDDIFDRILTAKTKSFSRKITYAR